MVINESKDKRQFDIRYFVCRADSNEDTIGLEGLTDFQWIFFTSVYNDKRFGEGYTCLVTRNMGKGHDVEHHHHS